MELNEVTADILFAPESEFIVLFSNKEVNSVDSIFYEAAN